MLRILLACTLCTFTLAAVAQAPLAVPSEPDGGGIPPLQAPDGGMVPLSVADLFADKCAGCHGGDGVGHTKYAKKHKLPNFTGAKWQKHTTDDEILTAIRGGIVKKDKRLMPAFGTKLGDSQVQALVPYLRSLAK